MNTWCKGCVWATDTGGKTYCPFVEGSCVKIKGTLENPDPDLMLKARVHSGALGEFMDKEKEEK